MPYLFVGAGQAGSAIVDDIFGHKNMEKIAESLVFNSTIRDLNNLSNIGRESWYGISETSGLIPGTQEGFEEQVTGGFGRNPVLANDVMAENADVLDRTIADELSVAEGEASGTGQGNVPFAFLFFGLGGGTGCGIAPYLAESIDTYMDGNVEIIAVCILPNTQGPVGGTDEETEATPSRQAWNTRYGLNRIEDAVDGVILVDNERLAYHKAAEGKFTDLNEYVAASLVDLISGPTLERIDRSNYDVDPPIIDIQDIVTTLSFGVDRDDAETGFASLGRSVEMTKSLPGYLLPFVGKRSIDATALAQLTEMKQTIEDIETNDAQKAIGLLRAPERYIANTKYQIDTSKLRTFLASRCDEFNLGATLTNRNLASLTTLFTFKRDDISRIDEIESLATEYEQESEAIVS